MKKSQVKFDKKALKEQLLNALTEEQNERLILYAQEELERMRTSHEFTNRTFNLEDSYVWAVYYEGAIVPNGYGFLGASAATQKRGDLSGREEAQKFLASYNPKQKDGWEVVWAATMPYGSLLEKGEAPRKRKFFVITQRYDHIRRTLGSKSSVTFKI